jgi:hypothetical protein
VLDEGARLEVIDRPTTVSGGKLTRVVVRHAALNVRDERHWEAWRKLRDDLRLLPLSPRLGALRRTLGPKDLEPPIGEPAPPRRRIGNS